MLKIRSWFPMVHKHNNDVTGEGHQQSALLSRDADSTSDYAALNGRMSNMNWKGFGRKQ
jgi:hypothetical protein